MRTLARQRRRWQRGLAETLWRHRGIFGRPRYGTLGLVAAPYFAVFELLGPAIEVLGYPAVVAAAGVGSVSLVFLAAYFVASLLLGVLLSVSALALEEFSFRRHKRGREAARLLAYAVIENVGYRQLTDLWRLLAFVDLARRRRQWGEMQRLGLGRPAGDALAEKHSRPGTADQLERAGSQRAGGL